MTKRPNDDTPAQAKDPQPMGPAIRLARIFVKCQEQRGKGKSQVDAWSDILEFSESDPQKRMDLTAIALIDLRAEVERVRILCRVKMVPEGLWEGPLNRADRCLLVHNLSQTFDSSLSDFANTQTSLDWIAAMLPATENEIPRDDRMQAMKAINRLEQLIRGGSLPDEVKFFLLQQLDVIRRALRDYDLRGATAIREAIYEVDGAVAANPTTLEQHKNSDEVVTLSGLRGFLRKSVDFAITTEKALTAGAKIYHLTTAAVNTISGLLPPGGSTL